MHGLGRDAVAGRGPVGIPQGVEPLAPPTPPARRRRSVASVSLHPYRGHAGGNPTPDAGAESLDAESYGPMKSSVRWEVWRSAQTGHLETWIGYAAKNRRDAPERRDTWEGILSAVERRAPMRAGERVLDVGGGLDSVLDFLPGARRFALDPLATRLAGLGLSREFANASGRFEEMPFRDASFDRVFLMNVLDHVRVPAEGLREIARVLGPGGTLVLSVDTFAGSRYARKRLHKWWARRRGARTKHPWVFSTDGVERMLRGAGLEPGTPFHAPGTKERRSMFVARRKA